MAQLLTRTIELYLALGLGFGALFVTFGAQRLDADARGAGVGFRALILPGAALLWPLLAWRWVTGAPTPTERTAHRRTARAEEATP